MQSPVNGTAPTSAPGRSAPFAADRLRRLARRIVLIAVAVGAGFVVAALFQGPAAADGIRGGSDAEPRREIGGLVEPVLRLTVAQRPSQDASPAPVPLPRVDASAPAGASEPETLRPASLARAAHRTDRSRPAAESPRQSATAVPDPPVAHRPGDSPVVGLINAPLPYVVDLVNTVPIRPAVTAVLHVVDAVLPPVLDAVIVPAATPPLPVPPVPCADRRAGDRPGSRTDSVRCHRRLRRWLPYPPRHRRPRPRHRRSSSSAPRVPRLRRRTSPYPRNRWSRSRRFRADPSRPSIRTPPVSTIDRSPGRGWSGRWTGSRTSAPHSPAISCRSWSRAALRLRSPARAERGSTDPGGRPARPAPPVGRSISARARPPRRRRGPVPARLSRTTALTNPWMLRDRWPS